MLLLSLMSIVVLIIKLNLQKNRLSGLKNRCQVLPCAPCYKATLSVTLTNSLKNLIAFPTSSLLTKCGTLGAA